MALETRTEPEAGAARERGRHKLVLLLVFAGVFLALMTVVLLPRRKSAPEIRQAQWQTKADGRYSVKQGAAAFFRFDVQGDKVLVPDSPAVHFGSSQDFAVEAWFKCYPAVSKTARRLSLLLGSHPGAQRYIPKAVTSWVFTHAVDNDFGVTPLVDKHHTPSTIESVGFQMYLDHGLLACQLSAAPMRQLAFQNFVAPGPNLDDRRWHHVAMSVQRTSKTGGRLYVDGRQVLAFDPTKQAGDLSNSEPVRIGNHANPTLKCFFKGAIGDVAIYRRALRPDEIAASFKRGRSGP